MENDIAEMPIHSVCGIRASEVLGTGAVDFAHGVTTVGELLQKMSVLELGELNRVLQKSNIRQIMIYRDRAFSNHYEERKRDGKVPDRYYSELHDDLVSLAGITNLSVVGLIISVLHDENGPLLIEIGANTPADSLRDAVSKRLDSILMDAIQKRDVGTVSAALDAGANPAATTENGPVKDCKMSALDVTEYFLYSLRATRYIQGTLSTIEKKGKLTGIKELLMKSLAAAANGPTDSKAVVLPNRTPAAQPPKAGTGTMPR